MTTLLLLASWLALAEDTPATATAAATATTTAAAPAPAARTYTLDASKSWVWVLVRYDRDRWTPITAHDHGVKASTFTGSVQWDPANPAACKIDISVPVTALVVDPPGMRERAGLDAEGAVDEDTKKTIVKNMCSSSNLECDKHQTLSFKSASCTGSGTSYTVAGDLTIRGKAKRVSVPMTIEASDTSFKAKGSIKFNHADFGMTPFTYGPGLPKNEEGLKLTVDVVGAPSAG